MSKFTATKVRVFMDWLAQLHRDNDKALRKPIKIEVYKDNKIIDAFEKQV